MLKRSGQCSYVKQYVIEEGQPVNRGEVVGKYGNKIQIIRQKDGQTAK